MRQLIINADDFGIDLDVDIGIFFCALVRSVSRISVIVTNKRSHARLKKLVTLIRRVDSKIGIGLHINLTDKPLLTCDPKILCESYDSSLSPKVNYWINSLQEKIDITKIEKEIREQYNIFCKLFKIYPSHVNGHNHCHISNKTIFQILSQRSKNRGVGYIRVPLEEFTIQEMQRFVRNREQRKVIESLNSQFSNRMQNIKITQILLLLHQMEDLPIIDIYLYNFLIAYNRILTNKEYLFRGTLYGHTKNLSMLINILKKKYQEDKIIEIMVHPGFYFPIHHKTRFSNFERCRELINVSFFSFYLHIRKLITKDKIRIMD